MNAVAQNEEKNKNVTNDVYFASLREHIVRLNPTEFWSSQVMLMQGYDLPYIVYNGRKYYLGEKVEGILFTAEIFDNGNNTYGFEITAYVLSPFNLPFHLTKVKNDFILY